MSKQDEEEYDQYQGQMKVRTKKITKGELEKELGARVPDWLWRWLVGNRWVEDCEVGTFSLDRLANLTRRKARRMIEQRKLAEAEANERMPGGKANERMPI